GSGRPSSSNPSSPHGSEYDDSSTHPSPSTTPTTPQKALPQNKQDTLTVPGALQVQVQSAGGTTQHSGPVITLEVPTSDQHRCLSPITELPTPVPTPVPSPLPTPCRYRPKPRTSSESNDNKDSEDTESEFSLSISVERSSSDSSGPDHRVFFTSLKNMHSLTYASARSGTLSPTGATVTPSSSLSSRTPSPVTSPNISPATSPKIKTKPPPLHIPNANLLQFSPEKGECSSVGACGGLSIPVPVIKVEDTDEVRWDSAPRMRSQSVDVGRVMQAPLITISSADDDPQPPPSSQPQPIVIPTLNVTLASPPALKKQFPPVPTISIEAPESPKPPVPPPRRHPLQREKAGSLDLQPAPAITITSMLSEVESDTDSPTSGCRRGGPPSCYLSPFLGVDLRASESNLSSSGYSSAYSPGPSRCSSNNPLCPEEPSTPSVSSIPSRPIQIPIPQPAAPSPNRTKRRPLLKSPPTEIVPLSTPSPLLQTDSETTDDPAASQPEADSALELDTNDECSDGVMQGIEAQKPGIVDEAEAQRQRLLLSSSHSFPKESPRLARSPPAIVVHSSLHSESSLEDCLTEKPARLSPVSSRSESPISDSRLSVARIYPAFFGVSGKPELPYTDSDGLYDCPSSEVLHSDSHPSTSTLKRLGRKRLKRSSGKGLKSLLGLGGIGPNEGVCGGGVAGQSEAVKSRLEPPHWDRSPRRHSPKRRVRAQTSVDLLTSSNESITSQSPVGSSSSPGENGETPLHEGERGRDGSFVVGRGGRRRRPLLRGESIPSKYLTRQGSMDASGEETQEEQLMLRPSRGPEELPRHRKVSRFRNFGNQIRAAEVWVSHCRFLRRLQLSRGAKDHLVSPAGSSDSDPEAPLMGLLARTIEQEQW
ncbi:putative Mucin-5AC-like 5, partial [Homarus americanus]